MLYTDFFASQNKEAKSSAHQRVRIFASQKQGGYMDILKACGLRKIYGSGETAVHALDGVILRWRRASLWQLSAQVEVENQPFYIC